MRTQSRIDTVYVERRGKEPEPRKSEGAAIQNVYHRHNSSASTLIGPLKSS